MWRFPSRRLSWALPWPSVPALAGRGEGSWEGRAALALPGVVGFGNVPGLGHSWVAVELCVLPGNAWECGEFLHFLLNMEGTGVVLVIFLLIGQYFSNVYFFWLALLFSSG